MIASEVSLLQAAILAVVQGLTEFLPISSSAHLILASELMGWPDQGLAFDVAVHVGTLIAVVLYFRGEITSLFLAWLNSIFRRQWDNESKLAWFLILATVPAGLAGLLAQDLIEANFRSSAVIAVSTLFFAALLWIADQNGKRSLNLGDLSWKQAFAIGLGQCLALIPGTSRSGITMTVALFCGLDRQAAAKFSFLLAIPIILASGLLQGVALLESGESATISAYQLLIATALAAVVAGLCIHFFLKLIERIGFLPFIIYRFCMGIGLLFIAA